VIAAAVAEGMALTEVSGGRGHPRVKASADQTKTPVEWMPAI